MSEWRCVFFGRYAVSNDGTVRNQRTMKELKGTLTKGGYLMVQFRMNGRRYGIYVHRLVAEAFIDNPDELPEVNHKDLDKTNNAKLNLEWCTRKENAEHASDAGRFSGFGNPNKRSKLTPESVIEIRTLATSLAHKEIARRYGICRQMVGLILSNERWKEK